MSPWYAALLAAGKIAGPLARKAKSIWQTFNKRLDKGINVPEYIHPYGTVGAAAATNAYLYGGLIHDAVTGSSGPIEEKKLASIWNELDEENYAKEK